MNSIEQAREALTERLEKLAVYMDNYQYSGEAVLIREAIAALASPSTPVDGVGAGPRVKPLEWTEIMSARSNEDPTPEHTGDFEATTPFGTYYIEQYFGSDSYGWNVTINGYDSVADRDDPEDAKSAAQADYERRVVSALASPEAEARLRERVAEAEERAQKMHRRAQIAEGVFQSTIDTLNMWDGIVQRDNNSRGAERYFFAEVLRTVRKAKARAEARLAQAEGGGDHD